MEVPGVGDCVSEEHVLSEHVAVWSYFCHLNSRYIHKFIMNLPFKLHLKSKKLDLKLSLSLSKLDLKMISDIIALDFRL